MRLIIILALVLGVAYAALNHRPVTTSTQEPAYSELKQIAVAIKERKDEARARASFRIRVEKQEAILANSPLSGHGESFTVCEERFDLLPGTLAGIARAESSLGRHYTLTNNPWNYGIYLGITFDSIADGACHVARKLSENYNTKDILVMANKYAPAADRNNPSHWAGVVEGTIAQAN